VWQSLTERTGDADFTVIAVALDEPEAARPWIEAAAPTFPCLVDREHRVAELYHLTNVPQAVWIDEHGRIARPAENAGSTDAFRAMDRSTGAMPAEALAERQRVKAAYCVAVEDWARRGAASPHVDPARRRSATVLPDAAVAEAHAHFRLGQALRLEGREAEAQAAFAQASRLHPESWAIWRQAAGKNASGLAAGPDFWARVDALGDKPYHRPVDLGRSGATP
jgi:hypothetical protein